LNIHVHISKRLETIASFVAPGSRVADIGSDHAYLPTYLVQTGRASSAIAGEVNQGPYESAKKQIEEAGLSNQIDVRLGNGLSVLKEGEVDTVCIAGMGGTLIRTILEEGASKLTSVNSLILQPNVAEKNVREWLYESGWQLKDEHILKEDGVIYEVLYATSGDPAIPYKQKPWQREEWYELGPFLWYKQSPVYKEKWEAEKDKVERVLASLDKAQTPDAEEKKREMNERKKWIEEVLKCMQKDSQ
jgi:tRNA (adenine22-N1)-methyltransferase